MTNNRYITKIANNKFYFVVLSYVLFIIYLHLSNIIFNYFGGIEDNPSQKFPLEIEFFLAIILGPIFETILFLYIPFMLLVYEYDKKTVLIFIIFSSFLFALFHTFGIIYFIHAFIAGSFFATFYFILKKINFYPSLLTILFHSLINSYIMIYDSF